MNRFIGIIVSLLFATYNVLAEDLNQLFLHYTTEEGLSSNNVHDITEDAGYPHITASVVLMGKNSKHTMQNKIPT